MTRRPLSFLALLLILLGGAVSWYVLVWLPSAPLRVLTQLQETLRAERSDRVEYFFHVNQIKPRSNLVVAEIETTVTGQYASEKEWLGVDLGTTAMTYEVPVRFFYAVDVSGPTPIRFEVQPDGRKLVAIFYPLKLFALEPDLGALKRQIDVGWARTERFSGEDVRKRYEARVMEDLREKGGSVTMRALAEKTGREQLQTFVRAFIHGLSPESLTALDTIEVRFQSGARPVGVEEKD